MAERSHKLLESKIRFCGRKIFMRNSGDDIKKRPWQRENMVLRRLEGMLAKMAKAGGGVMIF